MYSLKTLTIGALVVLLIFGAIGAGNPTRVTAEGELTHLYLFNGDLDDELNGPDLVSDGGTESGGRYVFDENEGLSLAGALEDTADYSIVIVMQFATLSGYQKVIDFENLSED